MIKRKKRGDSEVGKFNAFYKQLCELRDKHPEIIVSSYSKRNLTVLKQFCDWFDNTTTYYSSDEFNTLMRAQKASQAFRVQPTPENTKALMAAIGVKLRHDVYQRVQDELKHEIFPGLKEAIWQNDSERKTEIREEETQAEIMRIESQWEKHNRFASLSSDALVEMIIKMTELDQYMSVLNQDITNRSGQIPKEIQTELAVLAGEFYELLESARHELIDAALARLVLVPANVRHEIGLPGARSIPADQRFDENVVAPVLASLVQVGLDKAYVDAFIRYTSTTPSTLTKSQIVNFQQFVSTHGNVEQKKLAEKLFEMTHEKQTEFTTFPEQTGSLLPAVDLPIGEKGKEKQLDAIETKFAELEGDLANARAIATLFGAAKMHQVNVVNPFGPGLAFAQSAPFLTPTISESDSETSESVPPQVPEPSEAPEVPEKSAVRDFPMTDSDKIRAMRDSVGFISRYAVGDFEKGSRHTRQGRAMHLVEFINQTLQGFHDELLNKKREERYRMLIVSLFMHYLSIRDANSELSKQIEKSLIHLLGIPSMDMTVIQAYRNAVGMRGQSATPTSGVPSFFKKAFSMFQSQAADTKTDDPVCLFLKDAVIRYFPGVRDMMFDPSGQLNEKTRQLVEVFKQKDYQESKYMGHVEVSKADFDSMMKPTRELKKK
jgi:hypothetical protein